MKKQTLSIFSLLIIGIIFFTSCKQKQDGESGEWINLLDKDLTQWSIYQSYTTMPADASIPSDDNGTPLTPIGYDKNIENVFTTIEENDELLLHINGKIYGCIFTKQDFRNYHLKLKYKFGTAKYPPREDKAMDSGLLYHSQGEAGVDYWHSWMLSQEFQVMEAGTDEGVTGDYWPVASAKIQIRASKETPDSQYKYDPQAELVTFGGFCRAIDNFTNPANEWTTIELICYEGKSIHIVNGEVAMALQNSSLLEGKIQLQCEAAELFYKDISIKTIDELPEKYKYLFNE